MNWFRKILGSAVRFRDMHQANQYSEPAYLGLIGCTSLAGDLKR